ncbi:MAG: glycine cleavage system protein GcvH [Anaerolineaceae bacterium]|nr:glycine cleavage system protein GcvH [Anaerolineaceae bacterium]
MEIKANLKYANSDEWVSVEGKIAIVGVSDYAQDQLSDVVFVEVTPAVGETIKKSNTIATIESVKAAADVVAPVSGKVLEVNEDLANSPEQVNADPYGAAWLLKVEMSDPSELDTLMDAKDYEKYCADRSH